MPDTPLTDYHAKRSFDRTPEPGGGHPSVGGNLFVVQKHAATRTHYDFRIELDGVLKSWAVPKTPSYDQADKRVAIHVEDHPVEYADFEGVIPADNYGAGPVIVWDRGVWVALEDPHEGFEKGKLLFELRGYKLRGRWTLVKIRDRDSDADNTWLLIKERDGLEGPGRELSEESIFSGLTVEQLGEGYDPAAAVEELLDEYDAPEGDVAADDVAPMLAETRKNAFDREGWVFELKYDGYRTIAALENGAARLLTRNGNDITAAFPDVASSLEALPYTDLVLDGEIVVHDARGLPSFQRLQQRARLSRPLDVKRAAIELPATLYLFDCIAVAGRELRGLPLLRRKDVLRRVLPPVGPLRYSDHIHEKGTALFRQVESMELEGIVAKNAASPYRSGRSADWLKIRADLVDDFVVVGWTEPKGGRGGFGALHLGAYHDGRLVYAGRAGSGFSDGQLDEVAEALEAAEILESGSKSKSKSKSTTGLGVEGLPVGAGHHAVDPDRLPVEYRVAEVRYREWTDDGLLRHPVFLRFRPDKDPAECERRPDAGPPEIHVDEEPEPERDVRLTNLDKVYWPADGYTKGDMVRFYEAIAPWLLPYLRGRPLVMTRYPDGIDGKSFYQKDMPDWAPDWIRTETVWSEGSERELSYLICDNVESLLYVANSGSIPLHIWHSRVGSLERPDWCVIDLDPKDAPFEDVITVALALHSLCDEIGLDHYVKTSGSSGIHVLVPLARLFTHEQSRILGHLLSQVVVTENPEVATLERVIEKRAGKVYLDYLQNGHGKLIAAPFSVRPRPGAPVSAPLDWDEVKPGLEILDFTIANMVERMERRAEAGGERETGAGDPMAGVLASKPDLAGALGRLQERLNG